MRAALGGELPMSPGIIEEKALLKGRLTSLASTTTQLGKEMDAVGYVAVV
jgi:hypothetical protein